MSKYVCVYVVVCDHILSMYFVDNLTEKVNPLICLFNSDEGIELHSNIKKKVFEWFDFLILL